MLIAHRASLLALTLVLALPLVWLSLANVPPLRIDIGTTSDPVFLSGIHRVEKNATENYRWTERQAALTLPNLSGGSQALRLRAHGWRPLGVASPVVWVDVAGRSWTSFPTSRELRIYDILLPRDQLNPHIRVDFRSDVYTSSVERREVGFALDWIELFSGGRTARPALWQWSGQALLLALLTLLLWMLRLPTGVSLMVAVILDAALIGANLWQPLWVSLALLPWLIIAGGLVVAMALLGLRLQDGLAPWMTIGQARATTALVVAALALRLAGAAHPLFDIHDIEFHTRWLDMVTNGQLYIYSTPSEFQNRTTFNPPAGYVLLMPLQLLLAPRLAVQVGLALLDGIGCLLLVLLACELELPARAGMLALILYLALPINMTMLWWGFATNNIAQVLWLLLAWLLVRLSRHPSLSLTVVFAMVAMLCWLAHIGALVLVAATLGLMVIFGWPRLSRNGRRALIGSLATAMLIIMPLYFSAVVGESFGRPSITNPAGFNTMLASFWSNLPQRLRLASAGLMLGFLPLLVALAPLGLERLWSMKARSPLRRPLLLAWLMACLAFFGAYLGLGLVVRFLYFAAPLICLALGVLLALLWQRQGRSVVLAVVLLVCWRGVALWVDGVLMQIRPSGLPLVH